jgi:hypothetical protein
MSPSASPRPHSPVIRTVVPIEPQEQAGRQPAPRDIGRTCFAWSIAKIRLAALVLLGAAAPAALGLAAPGSLVKGLCVAWLLGVAYVMHHLGRRIRSTATVLAIDERGILDRRLLSRRVEWREIAAVFPVRVARSHVVDLALRRPEITLAGTRWCVRIGAACQKGYGVPALSLSMLLLDGNVSELLQAIAMHRPDLLHQTNRRMHHALLRRPG